MLGIHERITMVVTGSKLTKTAFAKRINVSQAMISMLCAGTASPSDRTIRDICDKFNVNEDWLRTGEGEMTKPISRNERIASFMGNVMGAEDEDFRKRLIDVLSELEPAEWSLLEKMALKLAAESKKEDQA